MTGWALADISCLLFVPASRPDRFDKARAASPEGIVIDLEDAVAAPEKAAARDAAARYLAAAPDGPPVLVRINALDTRHALDDLAALADGILRPAGLFLAKVEQPRDVELVRAHLPRALPLLAAVETAAGMSRAAAIARALGARDALGFGGADYAADLGAAFSWEALFGGRAALVQAAACGRVGCFDVPCLDIADGDLPGAEAARVRAMGFTGKLAIHPVQVAPIRAAFRPQPEEVALARRVAEALDRAGGGAVSLDGKMIDGPVARSARRTLARASRPD